MAVGRGSMERAAKAAGGAQAGKSSDKGQAPARRLTISEIVGEPSYVEPPRTAKPAPARSSEAAVRPAAGSGAVKPAVEKVAPAVKPAQEKVASAIKPAPEKAAAAGKAEPVVKAGAINQAVAANPSKAVAQMAAAEKAAPARQAEAAAQMASSAKAAPVNRPKPEVKPAPAVEKTDEKAPEVRKAPGAKEAPAPKVPEMPKAPEVKGKTAALKKEADGEIVYQKSSGMLERAAEPNERFGLGDAMPVYYF